MKKSRRTFESIWVGTVASFLAALLSVLSLATRQGSHVTMEELKHSGPIVLGFLLLLLAALVLFTFLLRRQPSEVTTLKKALISAYLGALESSALAPSSLRDRHNA